MTVSVLFSETTFGTPISLPEDLGELSPGDSSDVKETYITHDGTAKIEDCKFYILPYSAGVYLGAATAQEDYDTLIGWGDASTGGLYINMDDDGGFPPGSWQVFKTGSGDALGTAFDLPVEAISTGAAVAGEIAAGGEAHVKWRLDIPSGYGETGIGYIDTLMYFTATS